MLEFQSIKTFLLNDIVLIGQKKLFISKIKNTIPWAYVIDDLNGKDIVETFYEKK